MGSPTAEQNGSLRAGFLVAIMLLALTPIGPVAATHGNQGVDANLQAQHMNATFDPVLETTTITWENIVSASFPVLNSMFGADYNIYRSSVEITEANLSNLTAIGTVKVCDASVLGANPGVCSGDTHPGHSFTYPVAPGVNGTFYYAITTMFPNGTEVAELILNASQTELPVLERTKAVQTPIIVSAIFDAEKSETTLLWVNWNEVDNVLPTTGPDALKIRIWRTDVNSLGQISRSNGDLLPLAGELIVNGTIGPTVSKYVVSVPPNTQRESYYSITYLLPNASGNGLDYEDFRFINSRNTMTTPVVEDNRPPPQPFLLSAEFVPNALDGSGYTNISWADVATETGETYRVYRSDQPFVTILRDDVELMVSGILEGINSYQVQVPRGYLGYSYYCVVTVDATGVINTDTTGDSCTNAIEEDAFYNWVAEPTNVYAEFLGDHTTRVTWDDQLGVEGEVYHVWYSTYRVNNGQFVENETLIYMGTVSDGVGYLDVEVPNDEYRTNSFYWVTTEALYGNVNGTYHYTGLVQNYYQVPLEDTRPANPARIKNAYSIGSMNLVSLEWFNSEFEDNESYAIWRHYGAPFGDDENDISTIGADGWELVLGDIVTTEGTGPTITREFNIPSDVDRDVWYAVTITDEWGNFNDEIFAGFGGNAFKVAEDTLLPNATLAVIDGEIGRAHV